MKRRGISNSIELEELRKNTPLASMKETFKRQIEGEEAYRVKVLRNVATFCKFRKYSLSQNNTSQQSLVMSTSFLLLKIWRNYYYRKAP